MKAYQENLKAYQSKCQSLQAEKESLKTEMRQLEWEISSLKQQLDSVSVSSRSSLLSHHKVVSLSCSSLPGVGLADVSINICMLAYPFVFRYKYSSIAKYFAI